MNTTAWSLASAALRGRSRPATAAFVLVVALAAAGITAGFTVQRGGPELVDERAAEADVADLAVFGPLDNVASIATESALSAVSGPFPVRSADLILPDGGRVPARAVGMEAQLPEVGRPLVVDGRWLSGADGEVVVEVSAAEDLGISIGDDVRLQRGELVEVVRVVGTAIELTDCLYPQCDPVRLLVAPATVQRLSTGEEERIGLLLATLDVPASADAVATDIGQRRTDVVAGITTWPDTRSDLLVIDSIFSTFLQAFGLVVIVAAGLVVAGTLTTRVVARRRETAVVKALGATPGETTAALFLEQGVLALVGVGVGWLAGSLLAPVLRIGIGSTFGGTGADFDPAALFLALVVISGVVVLATAIPASRAGRASVTAVLTEHGDRSANALQRWVGRAGGRPSMDLGVADAASRPSRTAIGALGVAVATIAVVLAVGMTTPMRAAQAQPAAFGDPWDIAVIAADAPLEPVETLVDQDPRVESWFTETGATATVEGADSFLLKGFGGPLGGARLDIGEGRPIASDREALLAWTLFDELGVDLGDEVALRVNGADLTVQVVGWYRDTEDGGRVAAVTLDALRDVRPDLQPAAVFALLRPDAEVSEVVPELLAELGPGYRAEMTEADDDIALFSSAVGVVAALVVGVVLAQLISAAAASSRERARSLGVTAALGATPGQLVVQGATAGGVVGLGGVLLGVPLGLAALGLVGDAVTSTVGIGPGFIGPPSPGAVVIIALAAVLAAAATGATASRVLLRRPIPALLRYE